MLGRIGLYYPSVEFKDDSWVKLAALYWDKLGRMVPLPDYKPHDSETVRRLIDELDFIKDFVPSTDDLSHVSDMFLQMIFSHGLELKKHYSVQLDREPSISDILSVKNLLMRSDSSYVMSLDMSLALRRHLELWGLARDDSIRLWLHPKLALIYMEALAAQMATKRRMHPVTDKLLDHLAIASGYSIERLMQALLPSDDPPAAAKPGDDEIEVQMATIALQSVLPRDLASMDVKKIIQLQKKHRDELTAFQTYIHDFVEGLEALQDISDPVALKAHLEVEYEKRLKPQLDDLKRCLHSLGIDTVMSALNIRITIPPLLVSAAPLLHLTPINPIIVGAGALAYSLFPALQQKQKDAKQAVRLSPAAYLLYVQEGLVPVHIATQVAQRARQMLFLV